MDTTAAYRESLKFKLLCSAINYCFVDGRIYSADPFVTKPVAGPVILSSIVAPRSVLAFLLCNDDTTSYVAIVVSVTSEIDASALVDFENRCGSTVRACSIQISAIKK